MITWKYEQLISHYKHVCERVLCLGSQGQILQPQTALGRHPHTKNLENRSRVYYQHTGREGPAPISPE